MIVFSFQFIQGLFSNVFDIEISSLEALLSMIFFLIGSTLDRLVCMSAWLQEKLEAHHCTLDQM